MLRQWLRVGERSCFLLLLVMCNRGVEPFHLDLVLSLVLLNHALVESHHAALHRRMRLCRFPPAWLAGHCWTRPFLLLINRRDRTRTPWIRS